MAYNKDLVAGKLRRWEQYLADYRLPAWEEIPDLGLYMEQVVVLLKEYLDYMPPELKEEQVITPAAINNYVRKRVMAEPKKKKYYRTHIAYLIMICTLKQSLSIATLQKLIPVDIEEEEVRTIYTAYVKRHRLSAEYFLQEVRSLAGPILDHDSVSERSVTETTDLITTAAILGGLCRLLAEKLLLLEGKTLENGGEIKEREKLPENPEE